MSLQLSSGPWGWRAPWKWFVDWEVFDYVTTRTFTLMPNGGNGPFYKTVRFSKGGVVNRMGLPNNGVLAAEDLYRAIPNDRKHKVIVSLATGPKDLWNAPVEFLHLFQKITPPPSFFEINISCPAMGGDGSLPLNYSPSWRSSPDPWQKLFNGCAYTSFSPLILKVGVRTHFSVIEKALHAGFHAIHALNSAPGYYPGPMFETAEDETKRDVQWGFSGPVVLRENLVYVAKLRKEFPKAHIIGGGGTYRIQDAFRYLEAGATGLALGSIYLRHPIRARAIARQLKDYLS